MSSQPSPSEKSSFLNSAQLYVLVDSVDYLENRRFPKFRQLISALVAAEVDLLQLRDKRLNDRQAVTLAKIIVELTRGSRTRFIMNDRVDLTVVTGADGVHLGQEDLTIEEARGLLDSEPIIGISTHSLDQAREGMLGGADYIAVGPIFPSRTKSFDHFVGTELLAAVAKECTLPVFAIGGIDCDNVASIVASGVRRIAVSGAVTQTSDPRRAAQALLAMLRQD